jgi:polyisoprenoid-binding protein YceI
LVSAETHTLGPKDATLTVRTGKGGAAAVAGHNLLIEVTAWSATLTLDDAPALQLTADPKSFKVREGTGGIQSLGEDDKSNIEQTINDDVLKGGEIEFCSTSVEQANGRLTVNGELNLLGQRRPLTFEIQRADDGRLTGEATFKQTDWGMKPYSALFGTLKVADELKVTVDGRLA